MEKGSREALLQASNSFFRIFHLNHLLYGESIDYIREFARENGERFEIDLSQFHILLTGWSFSEFSSLTGGDTRSFVQNYVKARYRIRSYLMDCGYDHEVFPYDMRERRIAILAFPSSDAVTPIDTVAQNIAQMVYETYCEEFSFDPTHFQNVTALVAHQQQEERIAPAAQQCESLRNLAFFKMETTVMTQQRIAAERTVFPLNELYDHLEQLQDAIMAGNEQLCLHLFDTLFPKIKNSFDIQICSSALNEIIKIISQCCDTFDLNNQFHPDSLALCHYPSLELLWKSLRPGLTALCQEIQTREKHLSFITQKAIHIMKRQYSQGITQNEIAAEIGISSAHLSRTFNREMGLSIPKYLTGLKMENACLLLGKTDKKIQEICSLVGISNAQYFSRVFLKHYGISPHDYRKELQ